MINYDFLFEEKQEDYQGILRELRSGEAQLIDIRERDEWGFFFHQAADYSSAPKKPRSARSLINFRFLQWRCREHQQNPL